MKKSRARLGWLAIAGVGALLGGCGHSVGKPYDASSVKQLAVGKATTHDARQVMGAPFRASPLRYTPEESQRLKVKCPDIAESWTYEYTSSSGSSCLTTLEFDTTGVLCNVTDTPAKGPQCHGKD